MEPLPNKVNVPAIAILSMMLAYYLIAIGSILIGTVSTNGTSIYTFCVIIILLSLAIFGFASLYRRRLKWERTQEYQKKAGNSES